jgi:hypothetical protein
MRFLGKALLPALALMMCLQAQDITKGSLAGTVRDRTGAVVPAANVKLTSQFGDRTTTTNNLGEYSFLNLVVGSDYTLSVDKTGFGTAKTSNIAIGVNRQTNQDVTIDVGSTVNTVEVTAEGSAGIDLSSTTIGADLNESLYKNTPVGRSIGSIMSMAPGVSDSGMANGASNPSINGASGLENEYIINGANVTDPAYGGFSSYSRVFGALGSGIDFDFIQEVQVQTGGFEAQYGQALGGVVNVLTKSGGNAYHGSFYGYFQPEQFEATRPNVNALLTASKPTYTEHLGNFDYGGDLGGYIIKDKLFWYGGFNPKYAHQYIRAEPGYGNAQLGTVDNKTTVYNYVGKINYNMSSKHQLEGSVFGDPSSIPATFLRGMNSNPGSTTIDRLSTSGLDYGTRTWTGRYNGAFSSKWIVSANYSDYYNTITETPAFNGYRVTDNVPVQEKTGASFSSGGLGFLENNEAKVHQFSVTSSHIFNLWGGHTFVYGYQFEDQQYADFRINTGGDFTLPNLPEFKSAAGKVQHGAAVTRQHMTSSLSSPIVVKLTRGDYSDPSVTTLSRYHSAFIEDSWNIGGRLTIKPGLRFEQQAMSGNALRYVFAHNWAPRIGVIFDPTGKRKDKVYANWGRFFEKVPSDISIRSFSFETSLTGAFYKDPGAGQQPNLSASNYVPGGSIAFQGSPDDLTLVAGGTRAEYQDEVVAGYDHEFAGGLTVGGRFVYRYMRRIIEDISGVNVTQALAGVTQQYVVSNPSASLDIFKNSTPCSSGANCDLSTGYTKIVGSPLGSDGVPDGFPNASRIYKGMQLTVSKRFAKNFQVFANYTLSKLYGNFQGSYRGDNGQTDPNISSLFDFTNSDGVLSGQVQPGVLPTDRTQQFKIFGNYSWRNLNFGLGWNVNTGTPITGLLDHPAYENSGEIPDGPRGAFGRTATEFPLNLHADYTWKFSERARLKFVADLFNVGNQVAIFQVTQAEEVNGSPGTKNPDFLKPASYQAPFNARLAIRFEF